MNASRAWLEAFLRQPLDAEDVAQRLAMLGAPVDAIEPVGADLSAFVVATVTKVRAHPDADKLRVTTVDDGSGSTWSVVCGAPNVVAGGRYPFARIGTTMPGGMVIERRKLRGEVSEGMLCSARELGLGEEHDGLLTLETDAPDGTPVVTLLGAGDQRLVVDVTPNRPDLFGHKGIARELAASLNIPFRLPEIPGLAATDVPPPERAGDSGSTGGITVTIADRQGCPRFLAGVVRNVKIGPTPDWLRNRLAAVGVRSINNVVDVTNYVMFELNQPMHAYDADALRGAAVGVRAAGSGEVLVTLDGSSRTIPEGALVIVDGAGVIGVAGVMGGRDSEVTGATTNVLLECAAFDPSRVRAARRALGMSTDASQRFERGTDRWGAVDAFRRAMQLLASVTAGTIDLPTVDCFPAPSHPPRIFLRPSRVRQVLGLDLDWREIERCLVAIGATVVSKPDDARIAVDVPGWRPDLVAEIDLIEEVARIHGYEAIPATVGAVRPVFRPDDTGWAAARAARRLLVAAGLSEVLTLPMVAAGDPAAPVLLNPLSNDHRCLRAALVPALLTEVERNWAVHTGDVRLFEVGTVFSVSDQPGAAPRETQHAAFTITGRRQPAHWNDDKPRAWDRWDAKELVRQLVDLAHPGAELQVEGESWAVHAPDGRRIGHAGPVTADSPPWADPVFAGEVELGPMTTAHAQFAPLTMFPAVTRDLTLRVPAGRPVADISTLLVQRGTRHDLRAVHVVDEYRDPAVGADARSVTVRLVFRNDQRTLTDTEVDQATGRLRTSLERELDVSLRSS
ncbi:MAG: phenylalanine--tRNA ligase subunit beta [Gemmatimonadales bacterium]|nr:phenylalanine--tRNA ligase subunit beta [Gemmatimonadales bacterium]